ncbi:DUF4126 domain-containing protein [Seonamhaeicola maritimus]|uniref:DUF4126 domain-containing protein n=1 Tax=Seonamhaeicola maritimus TaxID=2591822 RepID=A0A5C7GEK6_9FLAO|nr:DUF4126 domain-containing protein [Seonamhaeicola maritimus]TXG34848.1 DUF4126 domain-containing protein [Seonamhaeicola maritimus]
MRVLSKLIEVDLGNIESFKENLKENKYLKVITHANNIVEVYPKYLSSFPFSSKRKSSLNYYYKLVFKDKKVKVDYVLQKQIYYSLIFELVSVVLFSVLLIFYPKLFGLLVIFILALIFTIFNTFISFFKAKSFLKNEVLKGKYI